MSKRTLPTPARTYVNIDEAAELLNCSVRTVRNRVACGALKAYRFGPRLLRFDIVDVMALIGPKPIETIADTLEGAA